ncbi:MAG TPA: LLM class flavin-dependent oxidoreductase [Gemmatimonadaceae bacterium]|nr:LLM class flavin-dependent oxidoreductase [Gemmatimonadaceae bacterium]
MTHELEMGLDTFGDVTLDAAGKPKPHAQILRDVVAEAVLADQVGVDFIGLGEHHREDFAISAPDTVLANIAGLTRRIHLGTAVTVLSSDDAIRVFQRFSTLNALSNGRAEIILGRGSFTESFPLFGYALGDYEMLFEDKLDLFAKVLESDRTGAPVSWSGRSRRPVQGIRVHPPTEHQTLTTWIGVGGSPESVVRAARHGFNLVLAIIGGHPLRFRSYVDLYLDTLEKSGRPALPIAVHSPGHIAESDGKAREEYWSGYRAMRDRIGRERGWPPTIYREFEGEVEDGSLYVGSPETVAKKIASTAHGLGIDRFDMKYSAGTLSHDAMLRSIELYGREVIPRVRAILQKQAVPEAASSRA